MPRKISLIGLSTFVLVHSIASGIAEVYPPCTEDFILANFYENDGPGRVRVRVRRGKHPTSICNK